MAGGFVTERFATRDLVEDDVEQIFDVFASNPSYLALTSGASGEPGRFDLDMLRRDFAVAHAMPGGHMAGV